MNMESLINMDLEMFPDIVDMLEDVKPGDVVKITASFQVKELTEKKFTGNFEDKEGIIISKTSEDEEPSSEDGTDEEEPESEEVAG